MNSDRAAPTAEGIRSGWPGLSGAPAYLLALAVTSVAVVLRQLADPWLGDNFPLVMTFGAVAIAVWFGGYRPAILSAAVGYLACDILFVEPRGAFADRPVAMLIGIVAYIVSCGLIIAIGEGLRRTRKRLTADQATLAGVLASIDDNFAMVDRDWRYVYVNDRMVEVARRSREDLIGTLSWEIYPGLLGTPYEAAARRSMATQRPERITFYYPPRDRWFDTLFYPTAAGMSMLAADVTDQKRAESSLAQRVGELRTLYEFADRLQRTTSVAEVFEPAFDAMRDALGAGRASILLFDANNRMRFVASRGLSEAYRQAVDGHTPWTPRDTDATPIWVEHAAAADVEEWLRERLAAEGIAALAFVPLIAGGRLIGKFMLYYGEPRPAVQEKIELSQLIARQLALAIERHRVAEERQRALEALTASEERFRLATEAGSVGVWDWDIERNRVAWSDSLLCIHGISPEGFEGTIEFFSSLVHPDDRDRVAKAIDDALADRARYELEFRIRRPDGTVCWVYADAAVLRRDGRPYRMIGATVDITRRKESEEALRDANERKDEFLSTLAHELRNPLAPIVSTLDILQRAGDDAAIRARSGAVLERQVQHLVRLVDDLFDVARINHNRLELRRERVDLAEVLRQA
ncbi:MAG: PAS domain-containing protein, partial [Gemmatimonadales bacterium]